MTCAPVTTASARDLLALVPSGVLRQMLRVARHGNHVHGKCVCDGHQPALLHQPPRRRPAQRKQPPLRRQRRQRRRAKVVMPCRCSSRSSRKLLRVLEGAGVECGTALQLGRMLRRLMLLQRRHQRRWQRRSHRRRLWRRRRRQHALPTLVLRLWCVHQGFKIRLLCRLLRLSWRRRQQGRRQPPRLTRRRRPRRLRRFLRPKATSRWLWPRLWLRSWPSLT